MVWEYDKSESSYSAVFPKSKVRIVVEGDVFGEADAAGEFLPLKEGCYYHFSLSDPKARLSRLSAFVRKDKAASHGSIAPGTAVGYGRLYLEGAESPDLSLGVEVASAVVSYKTDYQDLLRQLTEDIADLQMQCSSCVKGLVRPDMNMESKNDVQRFFFLLGLVGNSEFEAALRQIVGRPHVLLTKDECEADMRRMSRLGRDELRQVASASRRIDLPQHLRGRYSGLTTIPERILTARRIESIDTQENRFVKYVLNFFLERLQAFRRVLFERKKDNSVMTVEVDIEATIHMLSRWSGHEFFKGVGALVNMPTGSVVLQRREGYREILRKWLQYHAGTQLVWEHGEDVYGANQRQMSALYEYWCFFRLLKIVAGIFGVKTSEIADKMIGSDGLSLKLKAGNTIKLDGTFDSGHPGVRYRRLAVEFSYNRSFSAKGRKMSWTLPMRPDYTVAFRPMGMKDDEAIENDLVTYVHFDAKYKSADLVSSLAQLGGDAEGDVSQEEDARAKRDVKRDVERVDILKMHAYRDAIRRTGGAYVLFPGRNVSAAKIGRENMEIIPGLGAFVMSPSRDSSEAIKGFLLSVARHLCDRITRWENYTYSAYEIYRRRKDEFAADQERIKELLIENYDDAEIRAGRRLNLDAVAAARYLDPNRYISVELKEAEKSLKWAYEHNLFILQKAAWNRLAKPDPGILSLISVAWHPPVNLIVQRHVGTMQARMILGTYPSCPFEFKSESELDEDYLVWEVHAIDTKTLETRLRRTAATN